MRIPYLLPYILAVPTYLMSILLITLLWPKAPEYQSIQMTETVELTFVDATVDQLTFDPPYNNLNARLIADTDIIDEIFYDDGNREWLLCLAINIYHEARGSSTADQIAVANVVKNRVDDWRWPNDLCDVVWDYRQFSWTHDGLSDFPREAEAWQKSQWIAYMTFYNYVENRVGAANHYHATYVEPYWTKRSNRTLVGQHYYMTY